VKDELSVNEDKTVLLKGDKIVVPINLQDKAIRLAHEGHQGLVKAKKLMRSKVWFPFMDKKLENHVTNCLPCQAATEGKCQLTPLSMSPLPPKPWYHLSADFYGPINNSEYILVVIDDYTRYPIVEIIHSLSAKTVIPAFDRILGMFGIPSVIKTDNGPPFNSIDFAKFAEEMGFHHQKITPLWPRSNAEVERFMKTIKKATQIAHINGKNWRKELQAFLRNYRTTPHTTTLQSPHKLLFGREPGTKLGCSMDMTCDQDLMKTDSMAKERMKSYADNHNHARQRTLSVGDSVLIKSEKTTKMTPPFDPQPAVVEKVSGTMITVSHKGRRVTRNISFFKLIKPRQSETVTSTSEQSYYPPVPNSYAQLSPSVPILPNVQNDNVVPPRNVLVPEVNEPQIHVPLQDDNVAPPVAEMPRQVVLRPQREKTLPKYLNVYQLPPKLK
jgi:hypothetical protein